MQFLVLAGGWAAIVVACICIFMVGWEIRGQFEERFARNWRPWPTFKREIAVTGKGRCPLCSECGVPFDRPCPECGEKKAKPLRLTCYECGIPFDLSCPECQAKFRETQYYKDAANEITHKAQHDSGNEFTKEEILTDDDKFL